jgi:hypothetical protein
LDKVACYISEQTKADKGKRRREVVTICGVYITGLLAFITAIIFYWQLQAFQSTDRAMHQTLDTQNADRFCCC